MSRPLVSVVTCVSILYVSVLIRFPSFLFHFSVKTKKHTGGTIKCAEDIPVHLDYLKLCFITKDLTDLTFILSLLKYFSSKAHFDTEGNALLKKFWRILLYVTDDAIAKLYVT